MSTVLTKPVLLDETGQAIVGKLDEIQQAIGGSGEFVPIGIRVTTPPTKTSYLAGEALDLSGIVVTLVASNGGMYDITGDCIFSPADGTVLTSSTTEVNISYTWYKDSTVFTTKQPISIKELASIAVTTPPTETEYTIGDTLDLTGIVVTATFSDGSTSVVTNDCVFSPDDGDILAMSDTTINISLTMGTVTKTTTQAITVDTVIYGVQWDETSSSTWSRTDSAADFTNPSPAISNGSGSSPFDNIMPWSGMQRVEDTDAGTLVSIPKYYYKWTRESNSMKLQISKDQFSGALVSPAHADRGDGKGERDVVYVGAYNCASTYKSTTGVNPIANITRPTARTNIHNLGSDIWQWDYAMYWTIMMLYLVEYANWDVQSQIGCGCGNNSSFENNGLCDGMEYHTGTNASARTSYGHVRYRYIEDLWAGVFLWVDGVYFSGANMYGIKNPSLFSDTTNGTLIGTRLTNGPGLITKWSANPEVEGFEYAIMPSEIQTSGSYYNYNTYICDGYSYFSSGQTIYVGASYNQNKEVGGFDIHAVYAANEKLSQVGARLQKLP